MTPDLRDLQRTGNVQEINGMMKKKKKKKLSCIMVSLNRFLNKNQTTVEWRFSSLIAIQYNQIPYRCFRPERYRFRGRRLQQQIETLPEDSCACFFYFFF